MLRHILHRMLLAVPVIFGVLTLLVEFNPTSKIFSNPDDERTEMYVTGRFG